MIEIFPPSSKFIKRMKSTFALQIDNWNDYSFMTLYHLYYKHGPDETDVTFIGGVKILKMGQTKKDYSLVTEKFERLSPEYVSVGTSLDYYQRLNEIPLNHRQKIIVSLNDVVGNPELVKKFQDEDGWGVSLFRDNQDWPGFLQDAGILYAGSFSALPDIDAQFGFSANKKTEPINFNFSSPEPDDYDGPYRRIGPSRKKTLLPDRVVVLVGRNGSGKSTLLSRLARVAFASPQERKTKEIESLGVLEPQSIGFMRVITISYSAFDSFVVPGSASRDLSQIAEDIENGTGRFVFCGLRDIVAEAREDLSAAEKIDVKTMFQNDSNFSADRRTSTCLKSIDALAKEFGRLVGRIRESDLKELFSAALGPLLGDPSFVELNAQVDDLLDAEPAQAARLFLTWSTGHKIALHVVASLVANAKPRSLILFDEPETHLHPPLMAALMHSVRLVLSEQNAFCVIATHSPVLLQETLSQHVRYIRRVGDNLEVKVPDLETFGENVGVITYNSFGLTASSTDYHKILDILVKGCESLEEIESAFPKGLSAQARAFIHSKFISKTRNQ